jgi:hypothetical protein
MGLPTLTIRVPQNAIGGRTKKIRKTKKEKNKKASSRNRSAISTTNKSRQSPFYFLKRLSAVGKNQKNFKKFRTRMVWV